jgi:cysteinyl-tRNA synthetase
MLSIYNTYTKKKEIFEPIDASEVRMYVCGPTVYDYFHIGNARSFIMADVIRKYLEYRGYKVKFLMNLTDVDDKIIKKSIEENLEFNEVSAKYINAFFEDIKKLKIKGADFYPKATEHMADILSMIEELEDKGFAYNVAGNVFYNVSRFGEYGKLSGKNIDDLISGARIEVNEEKKNPLDFALWKKAKTDEPYWNSRWGRGRPGWHIECSAMSCKHLGEYFDIHAGGNDLIFPHHENEIAQSCAATGKEFVKYWIHFGFLNIEDEKMSKSLGNFFTARDVLARYSAEAIRLFFAQAYYRGPLNFSDELLASAERGLAKLENFKDTIFQELSKNQIGGFMPGFDFKLYEDKFITSMDDDFNTAQSVAVIFDFVRDVNKVIAENESIGFEFFIKAKEFLERTANSVLGIMSFESDGNIANKELENNLIKLLIDLRTDAKNEKNYNLADKIRDKLNSIGIELKDSKEGTTFKVVK